jgi:Domain of unknown function (DUF4124)
MHNRGKEGYKRGMNHDFVALWRLGLATATLCVCVAAQAQWQWIDANGRRVYSDQPPPPSVAESKIVKRPGQIASPSSGADAQPTSVQPTQTKNTTSAQPSELDRKARELKAQEEAALKAQKEKEAQTLAQNCEQARKSLATLTAGSRITIINSKGEQDYLSDEQRAADTRRLQGYVGANCQ